MTRLAQVAALLLFVTATASAQTVAIKTPNQAVGFHGGATIDPEQIYAGVFWQTPPIASRFHLRTGIDGGWGNDLRVAAINIDFIARFPLGNTGWDLIQGGGPVIALTKVDGFEGTETSGGGSYLLEFQHRSGFFSGFRIGSGNTPSLKLGAGYLLKF